MSVHGKNTRIFVNQYDLSSFLKKIDVAQTVDKHDDTTFGSNSKTYAAGLMDGTMSLSGLFSGTAGEVDTALRAQLGVVAGSVVTQAINLTTIGNPARMLLAKEGSYKVGSPVADLVSVDAEFQASGGIQAGVFLHALGAETGAGDNATAVDNGASSATGWTAHYHQIGAVTGTSMVPLIQHSADDITYVDLVTFATATAATSERQQSAAATTSVNRYTRESRTGTFTSNTFVTAFARQK